MHQSWHLAPRAFRETGPAGRWCCESGFDDLAKAGWLIPFAAIVARLGRRADASLGAGAAVSQPLPLTFAQSPRETSFKPSKEADLMCGICGKYNFSNRAVERRELEKMTRSIRHRGPDDE